MTKSEAIDPKILGRLFKEATPSNKITTPIGKTNPYTTLKVFESIAA